MSCCLRCVSGRFRGRHLGLALLNFQTLGIQQALFALRVLGRNAVTVVGDAFLIDPFISCAARVRFLRLRRAGQQNAGEHRRQERGDIAHGGYSAPADPPGDTAPMPQVC